MRSSGPLRRAAPIAVAVVVCAALFCVRPLGLASAVNDSPAVIPLLCVPFLTAYALGYEAEMVTGLLAVAVLIAALQVANGPFSPIELMITIGPWIAGRIVRSRRRLADQLQARNEELLAQQAEAAREAQAEVGLLAGLLSGDEDPQAGPTGLELVAELVRQVQAAGLEVTYHLAGDGEVDAVSAELASRIVTEALTNALKHAPGAPVTVDIRAADGLAVTVENGPARHTRHDLAQAGGGYGLAGMRDRVLAHGGRFDAGPVPDGGWRVHADLPAR